MFSVCKERIRHLFDEFGATVYGIRFFLTFPLEEIRAAHTFFDALPIKVCKNEAAIQVGEGGILIKDKSREIFFCIKELGVDPAKFAELIEGLKGIIPHYNISKSGKNEIKFSVWRNLR